MVKNMEIGPTGTRFLAKILLKVKGTTNLVIEMDYGNIGIPMVKRERSEISTIKNELENGLIIMKIIHLI